MALKKVDTTGAVITLTAVGGMKTVATLECLMGDITLDDGTYKIIEDECHASSATVYEKVCAYTLKEGTLEMFMTGDKTDAFRTLGEQWLRCQGDFDPSVTPAGGVIGSKKAKLKFVMQDNDSTTIEFEALCISSEYPWKKKDRLMWNVTYQQTTNLTKT